jgi:hypothetical protein
LAAVDGREPAKGAYPAMWPANVDEQHPDPDVPALPMHLEHTVRNLDRILTAVESIGGQFAIASFMWMIPDPRVPLDLTQHRDLYVYLNRTLWPVRYTHLRRMADFQNRLFRAFAEKRHVHYVEVAARLPQDPDLFSDPIHMGSPGLRLQAWIVLQQLVPWLQTALDERRLPRPMQTPRVAHPNLAGNPRQLESLASVRATCH